MFSCVSETEQRPAQKCVLVRLQALVGPIGLTVGLAISSAMSMGGEFAVGKSFRKCQTTDTGFQVLFLSIWPEPMQIFSPSAKSLITLWASAQTSKSKHRRPGNISLLDNNPYRSLDTRPNAACYHVQPPKQTDKDFRIMNIRIMTSTQAFQHSLPSLLPRSGGRDEAEAAAEKLLHRPRCPKYLPPRNSHRCRPQNLAVQRSHNVLIAFSQRSRSVLVHPPFCNAEVT